MVRRCRPRNAPAHPELMAPTRDEHRFAWLKLSQALPARAERSGSAHGKVRMPECGHSPATADGPRAPVRLAHLQQSRWETMRSLRRVGCPARARLTVAATTRPAGIARISNIRERHSSEAGEEVLTPRFYRWFTWFHPHLPSSKPQTRSRHPPQSECLWWPAASPRALSRCPATARRGRRPRPA